MLLEEGQGLAVFLDGFSGVAHLLIHEPEVLDDIAAVVFAGGEEGATQVGLGFGEFLEVYLHEAEVVQVAFLGAFVVKVRMLAGGDHLFEERLGLGVLLGGDVDIHEVLLDRKYVGVVFVLGPAEEVDRHFQALFGLARTVPLQVVGGGGLLNVSHITEVDVTGITRLQERQIVGTGGFQEAILALMIVANVVEDLAEDGTAWLTAMGHDRRGGVDQRLRLGMAFKLQEGFAEMHRDARGGEGRDFGGKFAAVEPAFEELDRIRIALAFVEEHAEVEQGHAQGLVMRLHGLVAEVHGLAIGRFRLVGSVLQFVAFREVLERVDNLRDAGLRFPDTDPALEYG